MAIARLRESDADSAAPSVPEANAKAVEVFLPKFGPEIWENVCEDHGFKRHESYHQINLSRIQIV
jgi:hypothetical protein